MLSVLFTLISIKGALSHQCLFASTGHAHSECNHITKLHVKQMCGVHLDYEPGINDLTK